MNALPPDTAAAVLLPGVVALLVGVPLVAAVRALARRLGFVSLPREDRWHSEPTALHGGFAIWAAVLVAFVLTTDPGPAYPILGGGTLLFVFGALDDVVELRPLTKIVPQVAAAGLAVAFGLRLSFFGSEALDIIASLLWIVAITNAVNFLDNMDGLAAGVVTIAATYLGVSYLAGGQATLAALCFALVGALLAFLSFNFNPASIFMGDSGSQFLGFSIATLALGRAEASNVLAFVAVPAMTLLVPVLDTGLVTITRVMAGRSVVQGGRDHSSHRLVGLGLSEREAVAAIWLLGAVAGGVAALCEHLSYTLGLAVLPFVVLGFGLIGVYLSEVGGAGNTAREAFASAASSGLRRICDLTAVVATYYLAYCLRFEFSLAPHWQERYVESLPIVLGAALVGLHQQHVYRARWRIDLASELPRMARAVGLSGVLGLCGVFTLYWGHGYSRAVFGIHAVLLLVTLAGTRFSFTVLDRFFAQRRRTRSAVLVGSGGSVAVCIRALIDDDERDLWPTAIVDDDAATHGLRIAGLDVVGGIEELERCFAAKPFHAIIVTTRELSEGTRQQLARFANEHDLALESFHVEVSPWTPASASRSCC